MFEPPQVQSEPAESQPWYLELVERIVGALERVRNLPMLSEFARSKTLPAAFFEHFNAALALYDELIDKALASDERGGQVKCGKGCSNCCIDLVRGMTTPEVINIYHHVRGWPDVRAIFEYHRESAEIFMNLLAQKLQPGEPPPTGRDPRVAEAHVDFNRLNRPCGFLDTQTGCCRIYPVRPLACRYFFSLDPPETCSPLHVLYLRRRTRTVHLPERVHALIREIDHKFGFRPLNFLSGAFCQFAAEVMRTQPIRVEAPMPGPVTD